MDGSLESCLLLLLGGVWDDFESLLCFKQSLVTGSC